MRDVIHDTALFSSGHSVSFTTIKGFIQGLSLIKNLMLRRIVETSNGAEVTDYLIRRGFDIHVTDHVAKAAAANKWDGKEVLELLVQLRAESAAQQSGRVSPECFGFNGGQRAEITIPQHLIHNPLYIYNEATRL
jgi:hypothetical protein